MRFKCMSPRQTHNREARCLEVEGVRVSSWLGAKLIRE